MGMRITIQNKGVESAPIIIELNNQHNQSISTEAFGLSDIISIKGTNFKEIFNKDKPKNALKKAKEWIKEKGYSNITPEECRTLDKVLFAQIFRRGGGNKTGNKLDINKVSSTAANLAKTDLDMSVPAIMGRAAVASILNPSLDRFALSAGVFAGIPLMGLSAVSQIYKLIKSELTYFEVDGVTIQSTPILRSFAEQVSLIGNLNILSRFITKKKLRLLYVCFKTPEGKVGIKPLCKVVVKSDEAL